MIYDVKTFLKDKITVYYIFRQTFQNRKTRAGETAFTKLVSACLRLWEAWGGAFFIVAHWQPDPIKVHGSFHVRKSDKSKNVYSQKLCFCSSWLFLFGWVKSCFSCCFELNVLRNSTKLMAPSFFFSRNIYTYRRNLKKRRQSVFLPKRKATFFLT